MTMDSGTQFVVTAWRTSDELLQLRHSLYNPEPKVREKAVNKVFAWRLRKSDGLPLLLDSTADLVDVILQDEKGEVRHNALRLLYAAAISRYALDKKSPDTDVGLYAEFVTGVSDTQIDLIRDRPSWFPPGKSLQLPLGLFETRHRIVHRHLPSLAELKRAAKEALEWLWEWYWSQLDFAFSVSQDEDEPEEPEAVREKLNLILKTYVKERKNEIKAKRKASRAAESALTTFNIRFPPTTSSTAQRARGECLLQLVVDENMILPSDKKLGSSMSGAFLIWTPLILAFCTSLPSLLPTSTLLSHLLQAMNAPSTSRAAANKETDPSREGLHDWLVYVLASNEYRTTHEEPGSKAVENVLTQCFSTPSFWNLKLAASLLDEHDLPYKEHWVAVLEAASAEQQVEAAGQMDVDADHVSLTTDIQRREVEDRPVKEKSRGPQRVLGMWRPRPIGWMAEGWDDE